MNRTDRDATRVVRSWLKDGADRIPDRVLDAVEARLPATHQRRASARSSMMTLLSRRSVRYGVAAAVVVGASVLGVASFLPRDIGTAPTPGSIAPTPDSIGPTPEPRVLPRGGTELAPGSYTLQGFPARIVFDVPSGFTPCSQSVAEQGICPAGEGARAPTVDFLLLENVVEQPCSDTLRDPPTDSVDDIVAAILSLEAFEATPPVDVSIDGFIGKELVVTAPDGIGCELHTWATSQRTNGVGRGEVNELTILEIDGAQVMVTIAHFPSDPPPEGLAVLRQVVDSIRISR